MAWHGMAWHGMGWAGAGECTTTVWGTYHSTCPGAGAAQRLGNRLLWAVDCGLATSAGNGQWVEVARQPAASSQPANGSQRACPGKAREVEGRAGQGRAATAPTARSTSDSSTAQPLPRPGDHPTPPSVPAQHGAATTSSSYQPASIRTAGTPCLSPPRSSAQPCSSSTVAVLLHHHGAHTTEEPTKSTAPPPQSSQARCPGAGPQQGMPAAP
ncbi:hypothetical protein EDB80DRAFT_769563 [Ilyonectria destructans]|nr:hypothetical protein EDB80DRAFT_769563 [Ilyonectria destructans]